MKNRFKIQAPISFSSFWNARPCIGTAHNHLYTHTWVWYINMLNTSLSSKLPSVGSLQKETACSSVNMLFATSTHHHSKWFSWYSKCCLLERKTTKHWMSWQDNSLVQRNYPIDKTQQNGLSMKGSTARSQFMKTLCRSMEKLLFTVRATKLSSRKTCVSSSSWFDTAP